MPHWGETPNNSPSKGMSKPLPPYPDEIIPGLYISNIVTAAAIINGAYTPSVGPEITHVLSLYSGKQGDRERLQPPQGSTLQCKQIFIGDFPHVDIVEWFPEICQFVHEARRYPSNNVLVHCFAGLSRSVTAIAAYLIWALRLSRVDALTYIAQKRRGAMPNEGFNLQLQLWQSLDCNLVNVEESTARFLIEDQVYTIGKGEEGWTSDTRSGEANLGALLNIERPNYGA